MNRMGSTSSRILIAHMFIMFDIWKGSDLVCSENVQNPPVGFNSP